VTQGQTWEGPRDLLNARGLQSPLAGSAAPSTAGKDPHTALMVKCTDGRNPVRGQPSRDLLGKDPPGCPSLPMAFESGVSLNAPS
jgi:hypothetical protein